MSEEQTTERERDEQQQDGDPGAEAASQGQSEEQRKAEEKEKETEAAREKMKKLEEDPPKKLEDWPDDAAKYETFGGPDGQHAYDDGPEKKLGPSSLRHHDDGKVTVEGEEVDDPSKYKGDPIPGGPTDPEASQDLTTQKIRESQGRELESESGDGGSEGDEAA